MSETHDNLDLSVIVPVYDEKENLEPLVEELDPVLQTFGLRYEILLVDDGSQDGSTEIIACLARTRDSVRGLHFLRNAGQTAAIDAGFKNARGRLVVTLDADLQNDPADIGALLEALCEHDAVVGYRQQRADNWLRRLSSHVANSVRNRLSGDDIIDTGCALKLFRRECLSEIKLYDGMHRFLPTLLRIEGKSVMQLPVSHRPRIAGTAKYGMRNRALRALADLMAVRWMKKRHLDYEVTHHEP